MDYGKLDAALASALLSSAGRTTEPLTVSVRTTAPPDGEQRKLLSQLGVFGVESPISVFSAHLTPDAVDQLSRQPWVRLLSLSRRLTPSRG
jgi:hypothetical protein